jgi:hypothetical protein
MVSDSLINNVATDTGNVYIPAEFAIFGEHSEVYHNVSEITESKLTDNVNNLIKSGIVAGLIVYLLLILFILKGRIRYIRKMLVDYRFTKKQYAETSRISTMNTSYIIPFTIAVVSVQFALMNNYQDYELTVVPFLALYGVFIVQSAALKLIALICKSEDIMGEVYLNRKLYLNVLGFMIMPLTVMSLLYSDTKLEQAMFTISEILAGVLMLSMIVRILRVFSDAKVSYFLRFLYLCTLEISPYLALFIVFENIN